MRALLLSSLMVLVVASSALGEEVVREVSWKALKDAGELRTGEVVEGQKPGPTDVLKIENEESKPKTFNLLDLEKPRVTSIRYAVIGRVRYEGVEKVGYLEMWSLFAGGGMYFSRTLGDSGPLQRLEGASDWRPFSLPFFSDEKTGAPTKLVVNMVLPGKGTVYLGPLRVVQYEGNDNPLATPGAWWDDRSAGLIGGIAGTVGGLLGGLIGVLTSMGRARTLVLTLAKGLLILGVISLLLGLVALGLGQPYAVYYPLLLLGVILSAVMGANLRTIRRRYEGLELRRMAAMDVGTAG